MKIRPNHLNCGLSLFAGLLPAAPLAGHAATDTWSNGGFGVRSGTLTYADCYWLASDATINLKTGNVP
ncbi:MAG: hypothetical protein ABSH34_32185 [Verrucomicrobiota bacterium]